MKLVIVTGTTKGLGAALADALATEANNMVITLSRAPTSSHSTTPTLGPFNFNLDVSDLGAIEAAFALLSVRIGEQKFERAVLINNAGIASPVGAFDQIDAAALAQNLIVNVAAPMVLTQLFANLTRKLAAQRLVVNISSGAAKRAMAGWSAYCTSKAALEMATRVAALEATTNDPTLAICSLAPGVVDTPMQTLIRSASETDFPDVARFRAMKADGVLRDAHEVARDILNLIDTNRLTNGGNFDIREMTQ